MILIKTVNPCRHRDFRGVAAGPSVLIDRLVKVRNTTTGNSRANTKPGPSVRVKTGWIRIQCFRLLQWEHLRHRDRKKDQHKRTNENTPARDRFQMSTIDT